MSPIRQGERAVDAIFNNCSFCVLPWIQISASVDGLFGRCCLDKTIYHDAFYQADEREVKFLGEDYIGCLSTSPLAEDNPAKIETLQTAFNSAAMKATRRAMLLGKRITPCSACYEKEALGAKSYRVNMNETFRAEYVWSEIFHATKEDGHLQRDPVFLDLRLGNVCNLTCVMCTYPTSSAWRHYFPKAWSHAVIDPYVNNAEFWEEMRHLAPGLHRIYFAGGEPLIQPGHRRMLEILMEAGSPAQMVLVYNSNLGVIPRQVEEAWPRFRSILLGASCDGVGEVFERIRRGAHWPRFVANLRRAKNFAEVSLAVTLQQENISSLADIIRFAIAEGVSIDLSNFLQYPRHLSLEALPPSELARHRDNVSVLASEHEVAGLTEIAEQLRNLRITLDIMSRTRTLHPR